MAERPMPKPSDFTRTFWEATARGELLLQQDAASGRCQFYPRAVNLFGEGPLSNRPAAGTGTLIAITNVRTPAPGFEPPYLVGIVSLDEGPRVFARVLNAPPGLAPGAKMKLVWDNEGPGPHVYAFEPAL
jgi:uncharacterized protein